MNTHAKPTWITLASIGVIGLAAMATVPLLRVAPFMRTIMLLLIAAALFGAIGLWISSNNEALEAEDVGSLEAKVFIQWDVTSLPIQADTPISTRDALQITDPQEAA